MKLKFKINKAAFRLHTRYQLTMVNENSLAPVFEFSVRKSVILIVAAAALIVSGIFWWLVFGYTPFNRLMPVKLDTSIRKDYENMAVKVDSLAAVIALNDQYARNITALLNDTLIVAEADTVEGSFYDLPLDSLMTAGKAEEHFVKQFEASGRFNLSVLAPIAAEGMIFFPPLSGVSLRSNSANAQLPSLTVSGGKPTAVSAIYKGTVIDASYATDKGVTVTIQHPNNFVSQYSGLGDVFVSRGAKVNAGQRIGITAGERYPFNFMLWHDGAPLDAADYIDMPGTKTVDDSPGPFSSPK